MRLAPSLAVAIVALAASPIARAQLVVPHVGRLVTSDGGDDVPVTGTRKMRFSLHKKSIDPTGEDNLLWEDTYETIELFDGLYRVDLGDQTPLTQDDFAEHQTLWLEVSVYDSPGASMPVTLSPRMRFEPSARAHLAGNAVRFAGREVDDFLLKEEFETFKDELTGGGEGLSIPWDSLTGKPARLQPVIDGALLQVTASGALSGKGTGEEPLVLGTDSIGTDYLKDGAVTREKLAPDAVTTALFPAGSIGLDKLDQSRGAANCTDGAVLKLGSTGWFCGVDVGSGDTLPFNVALPLAQQTSGGSATLILNDGGITTGKLANDAVNAGKLASDAASLARVTGGAAVATNGRIGAGVANPTARFEVGAQTQVDGVGTLTVPMNSLTATISAGNTVNSQVAVGDVVSFGTVGSRLVTGVSSTSLTYAPPVLSTNAHNNTLSFKIWKPTARVGNTVFTADGAVGIGTNRPPARLTVAGAGGNNRTAAKFGDTGHALFVIHNSAHVTSNLWYDGQWYRDSANAGGFIDLTNGDLKFGSAPTGPANGPATLSERMRITAAGNVGIGLTNPTAKLHVAGDAIVTGRLTVGKMGNTCTTRHGPCGTGMFHQPTYYFDRVGGECPDGEYLRGFKFERCGTMNTADEGLRLRMTCCR